MASKRDEPPLQTSFLLKVTKHTILVPRPPDLEDGMFVEVTVKRVFVDEAVKKKIGEKGVRV